jgi:hypothetical protein
MKMKESNQRVLESEWDNERVENKMGGKVNEIKE